MVGRRRGAGSGLASLYRNIPRYQEFCFYVEPLVLGSPPPGTAGTAAIYPVSWVVPILPYIERTDTYRIYHNGAWNISPSGAWPPGGGAPTDPPPVHIEVLNCPSTPPASTFGDTPCVYVANSGMIDVQSATYNGSATSVTPGATPADYPANGVFFNHSQRTDV